MQTHSTSHHCNELCTANSQQLDLPLLTGTLFRVGRFAFTASLGSVIGIAIGGFVFGWANFVLANFVLKSELLRTYAMDISWSLGCLLGIITVVKQLKKTFWMEDESTPADRQNFKRQWPTLNTFFGRDRFLEA